MCMYVHNNLCVCVCVCVYVLCTYMYMCTYRCGSGLRKCPIVLCTAVQQQYHTHMYWGALLYKYTA